jgi:hypothetical protein
MSKKLSSIVASGFVFAGISMGIGTRDVVHVGTEVAPIVRSEADGLDALASTELSAGPSAALAACASWDVKDACCPAGCAAKNGTLWPKADDILRGCMRGLGCNEADVKSATVFMKCDCSKK